MFLDYKLFLMNDKTIIEFGFCMDNFADPTQSHSAIANYREILL